MSKKVEYGITKVVKLSWQHIYDMIKKNVSKEEIKKAISALYKKAFAIGGQPKMFIIDEDGNRVEYIHELSKYQKKQIN